MFRRPEMLTVEFRSLKNYPLSRYQGKQTQFQLKLSILD